MTLRPQEYRRRIRMVRGRSGTNGGMCVTCGKQTSWRSVNNRCRTCEMDDVKTRTPMWVEREILLATTNTD
ncbi:hypothetical protein KQI52_15905 [bacterium]|nr:hypothetical protein [bacterium]